MTKWLYITNHPLDGRMSGGVRLSRVLLKSIVQLCGPHGIAFVPQGSANTPKMLGIESVVEMPPLRPLERVLRGLRGDVNRGGSAVGKYVRAHGVPEVDVAFVDGAQLSPAVEYLRNIPIVAIHHNYEWEYVYYAVNGRLLRNLMARNARRLQRKLAVVAAVNACLSVRDKNLIEAQFAPRGETVVLGVATEEWPAVSHRNVWHEGPPCISVGGSLRHLKGYSGLLDLLRGFSTCGADTVIPKVIVTGFGASSDLQRQLSKLGAQVDEGGDPSQGDIYVNPSDLPGGIKIRNLDGLTRGLPVLVHESSRAGFENLQFVGGYHDNREFIPALNQFWERARCERWTRDMVGKDCLREYSPESFTKRLKVVTDRFSNETGR